MSFDKDKLLICGMTMASLFEDTFQSAKIISINEKEI